jgi:hypothetical protein
MVKREINTSLLDSITAATLEDYIIDVEEQGMRVERLLLELVRPDPVQPRRVLPDRIYHAFHSSKLTPSQALREVVQSAQVAARQRGRPFSGLLDLLPNPDDESNDEQSTPLSPEEKLIHDLVNLAITIRDDGQVNPLTVINMSEGITQLYRIETGERRYWATWLLRDFLPGYEGDGMIPCIIIPPDVASTFRQAKENTARSGLSAIAMARQAALLLLTVHDYEIPAYAVDNDFYRQALDLDLRGKSEHTVEVLTAMGGISKARLSRYKALLRLSDEALDLADRHNIDEKKLRYVITMPVEFHIEILRQIKDFNLTSKQIKEICEIEETDVTQLENPNPTISRQAMKLARMARASNETSGEDFARALIKQERDVHVARARLQMIRDLLDETEKYLSDE